ncbi:MAG: hypothetical protein ACM3US_15385 [Sphingomonadaceae bacterium]
MARALRVGVYLVALLLAASLILLLAGLAMAARPEAFEEFVPNDTSKTGMVVALAGGIGTIVSAALGWVLNLIRGSLGDQNESAHT